jgi:hypothetical protein
MIREIDLAWERCGFAGEDLNLDGLDLLFQELRHLFR